jgi:hypothetical protein
MRNTFISSVTAGCLLLLGADLAQAQELKVRPSPAAEVKQQIGTAMVTVNYSSPAVKKRKIFGELVPEGKLWRTGANASTKVTFTKDVTFGGKPVPAGTYALLSIPTAKSWTIILNKNTDLGGNVDKHDAAQDVAKFTVTPKTAPARERLTFLFSDVTDESGTLDLEWDKVRVSIPIAVPAAKKA